MTVTRIGFAYNPTIEAAVELSARAVGWCQVRGIDHWQAQSGDQEVLVRELTTTDALVVLGGDGTFLRAVRAVAEVDVPILGCRPPKTLSDFRQWVLVPLSHAPLSRALASSHAWLSRRAASPFSMNRDSPFSSAAVTRSAIGQAI